jgi:hypothetical protein
MMPVGKQVPLQLLPTVFWSAFAAGIAALSNITVIVFETIRSSHGYRKEMSDPEDRCSIINYFVMKMMI